MFPRFCVLCLVLVLFGTSGVFAERPQILRRAGSNGFIDRLVQGRDGAFYGSTANGKVFRLTSAGGYRVIYDFEAEWGPMLVAAEDGHLYGLRNVAGRPVLYRLSYSGNLETLHEFTFSGNEALQGSSLMIGPDGALYGLVSTYYNGDKSFLFRATLDGEVSTVANFANTSYQYPRNLITGHDGAFRMLVRVNTGNPWTAYTSVVRVGMDGAISSAMSDGDQSIDPSSLHAHPDGNYYLFGYHGAQRLSPEGEVTPLQSEFSFNGYLPLLAQDGFFYVSRYVFVTEGVFEWEIIRIATDGTITAVARNLPAPLQGGGLYAQSHVGDFFGVSGTNVYFRWRPDDQQPVNLPPYAAPDFARPPKPGAQRVIAVLANDRDVNGDRITITGVNPPRLGTAALSENGKTIVYTAPAGDAVQVDEFTYTIADGQGGTAVGRVAVRANIAGQFSALLAEPDRRVDGHITVKMGRFGAFSGRLWCGGYVWKFAGFLDADDGFQATIRNEAGLAAQLELSPRGGAMEAKITVHGQTVERVLTRPDLQMAAALSGTYTFVIPSELSWRDLPRMYSDIHGATIDNPLQQAQGDGYGIWRIARNGAVSMTGKMPDGAPFSAGNLLDRDGRLPMFVTMYPYDWTHRHMRGWARGWVTFRDTPGVSDADGTLKWAITVPGASFDYAPLEEEAVSLRASRYTVPGSLEEALPFTLSMTADGGGLQKALTGPARAMSNKVVPLGATRVNGALNVSSGLLQGHFAQPNSAVWAPWTGVLFQKQGAVFGRFKQFGYQPEYWSPFPGSGRFRLSTD